MSDNTICHNALSCISDWAQVNGHNELTREQKFTRNVWYMDHVSFGLDLKILCMTIRNVLHHSGINAGVGETMEPFTGNAAAESNTNV